MDSDDSLDVMMMTLKGRILCFILCVLTLVSLAACQPKKKGTDESEATTKKSSISVVDGPGGMEEIPWGDD